MDTFKNGISKKLPKKTVAFFLGFATIFSTAFPSAVSAHPLDVSATALTIWKSGASAVTALHPSEVERILGLRGMPMRSLTYGDYYEKKEYVFDYLKAHLNMSVAAGDCTIGNFETRDRSVDEIFSEGFPVSYSFVCPSAATGFSISIRIFEDLPLQTNRLTVFSESGERLAYKVLTPVLSDFAYDSKAGQVRLEDSDNDGLPDEEERAYRTDPKNPDTDGDRYSDGEEVNGGWNVLSSELSPGQSFRGDDYVPPDQGAASRLDSGSSYDKNSAVTTGSKTVFWTVSGEDPSIKRYEAPVTLFDSSVYGSDLFRKALKRIADFSKDPSAISFTTLFLLTIALGFVHAAGPGHSKSILVSVIIDRGRGFGNGLAFVTMFTITHIADVVILVLLTKFLFEAYDPAPYMATIQKSAAVMLALVSSYLVARSFLFKKNSVQPIDCKVSKDASPETGIRGSDVFLGFISGLAPCAFGWSIFLVFFSIGKPEWALPLLLALAIGIFLCLFLVLLLTLFFRAKIYAFSPNAAARSSQASSLFLFSVAVFALVSAF